MQQEKLSRFYYFSPHFELFCMNRHDTALQRYYKKKKEKKVVVFYFHTKSYNNAVMQCHVDGSQSLDHLCVNTPEFD